MSTIMKMAALLLLVGSADASCLSGIKGLLCGHRAHNYRILADHLSGATQSSKLADNTEAAESLLAKHPDANEDLVSLIDAFKSLKRDSESLCSKDNLANMRHVAEAMRREGANSGPRPLTEPVRRLNIMLIKYIAHAWPVCSAHFESKPSSMRAWNPSFSNEDMEFYVKQLRRMPLRFSYAEYQGRDPGDSRSERYFWGSRLSRALAEDAKSDLAVGKKLDPDCSDPTTSTNKTVLALQLREYVYRPCEEFVALEETNNLLVPYNNLIINWYISNEQEGARVYLRRDNGELHEPFVYFWGDKTKRVRDLVFDHATCQRLLAMPAKDVLSQLYKSRLEDQREQDENPAKV